MSDRRPLANVQREHDFFYRQDQELIERMRQRADMEAALRGLSAATGIADRELLRDLHRLGYEAETGVLLQLMPLVQVAWSDGSVSEEERKGIFHIAAQKGVQNGRAWGRLTEYLETEPPPELFRVTLRALRESHEALPLEEREKRQGELLMQCMKIASTSGAFLGFGSKISVAEESAIKRIVSALEGGRTVEA